MIMQSTYVFYSVKDIILNVRYNTNSYSKVSYFISFINIHYSNVLKICNKIPYSARVCIQYCLYVECCCVPTDCFFVWKSV